MTRHKLTLLSFLFLVVVTVAACSGAADDLLIDNSESLFSATSGSESDEEPVSGLTGSTECLPVAQMSCGEEVWGDTSDFNSGATSVIDTYMNTVGIYDGPEIGWSYHAEVSGEVTWSLIAPTPTLVDHDLFVLSGSQGDCRADAVVGFGFHTVVFDAQAGEDYVLLIDGYAGAQGAFEAELRCDQPPPHAQQECSLADPEDPNLEPGAFYRCLDSQLNGGDGCGIDGYPLAFAAKYAEIYMWDIYPELSPEGQGFLDANLVCLQSAFLADTTTELSCEEVAEVGFAAHPPCYRASGICAVPLADQITILLAVEWADLVHPTQIDALKEVAASCLD